MRTLAACFAALAALSFTPAAFAGHPSTIWDAATLEKLTAARETTHQALWKNLDGYLASGKTGVPVSAYAMAARLSGSPTYQAEAVKRTAALCATAAETDLDLYQARDLAHTAVAYDVTHDLLTGSQRDACRAKISSSAQKMVQAVKNGTWWVDDKVQNHNWVNHAAIGLAGQALEGEHPDALAWQKLADDNFAGIKAILDLIPDGSWHEGIGYMAFGVENLITYFMGASRRGNDDDKSAFLAGVGRYILSVQQPNHPRVHVMTHGDWNWSRPGLLVVLRWAARRFSDPYAQEAARRWDLEPRLTRAEFMLNYALEYVAYDPTVALPDMSAVPLDLYASDQEAAFMRSGWDFGADAKPMVVALKAGVFGGRGNFERMKTGSYPGGSLNFGHDHEDDLGLWIYGKGGWLLPEAVAYNCCYGTSEYHSTSWQNSFLFDGEGQLGDDKQPGLDSKSAGDSHPWFFEREASMPLHASTDHYAFARARGDRLYPASLGVKELWRTVALAREHEYVTLHDRVGLEAPRLVQQLFHSMVKAEVQAPWVKLTNQGDSLLGIRVIAPASFAAPISQQKSNSYQENMDDDGLFSLVKLSPAAEASSTTFLELLWPANGATWGARPDAQPLDATAPERGMRVPLGSGTEESWIFASEAGSFAIEGDALGDGIGVVRASGGALERVVLVGRGKLWDTAAGRTLLDLGKNEGTLEVAFTGTAAALSGDAPVEGVRFWGPDVTEVTFAGQPLAFVHEGSLVLVTEQPAPPPGGSGGSSGAGPTGGTGSGAAEGSGGQPGASGGTVPADDSACGVAPLRAKRSCLPAVALLVALALRRVRRSQQRVPSARSSSPSGSRTPVRTERQAR